MVSVARKHVYSVCGHTRYSEECPITPSTGSKTPLLGRFQDKLFRSEIPTRPETLFMMGFCHTCRAHYDFAGRSYLGLQAAILRYWAFKNWQGWARPVPANRVPLDILFGESTPNIEAELEAAMESRLELEMMYNEIACAPKTPKEHTFARLELVRSATLEWATREPSPFRIGRSHIFNSPCNSPCDDMTNKCQTKQETKAPPPPQADKPTLLALCGDDKSPPRVLDPECFDQIPRTWFKITGQNGLTAPKTAPTTIQQHQPVSRWSYSTVSSEASSADSDSETDGEEITMCFEDSQLLQPVVYQPSPLVKEEPVLLLQPVRYQPDRPEGNWI